jgi:hypothetical protein
MTKFPELFAALAAPFERSELKTKEGQNGRKQTYITARTAANRLDATLGPENWEDHYEVLAGDSTRCLLTIRLPDGSIVTKCDVGSGEDMKASHSDAFKRAAQKFGVARYLYRDGTPNYGTSASARQSQPEPEREPEKPATVPYRPASNNGNGRTSPAERTHVNNPKPSGPPRTGRQLFAWTKDQEQLHQVGLLKYLNQWAKLQEFPGRMVDFSADQVTLAHQEALRKLQSLGSSSDVVEGRAGS